MGQGRNAMAISQKLRNKVMMLDDFTCVYCGYRDADVTIDHLIPISIGGGDVIENLFTACLPCNLRKSDRPLWVAKMYPKFGRFSFVQKDLRLIKLFANRGKQKYSTLKTPAEITEHEQKKIIELAKTAPSRRAICQSIYGVVGGNGYKRVASVCDAFGLLMPVNRPINTTQDEAQTGEALPVSVTLIPESEQRRIIAAAKNASSRRQVCKELYNSTGGTGYKNIAMVCDALGLLVPGSGAVVMQ